MKRILTALTLAGMIFLILPARALQASLSEKPEGDAEQIFAPGSIVQFEHLNIEDGLSQNAGLAIFQDSRGYLWIGTQDGLNRFDGYSFKIYKHDPNDPNSLSHNSILSITEDKDGNLWIGTWSGGLNCFDPATETFTQYLSNPEDASSLSDGTVTSLRVDSNGSLWVGT
ncbi:MAG: hypothetical protein KDI66_23000, partial [Xanthomonadales bacterium]|nr:hypothetical protein [Xanthomonadales bacterium]